jgi:hypothetical protein
VGLFTYLSVVRRAPIVFTLTGGSMVWESIAIPNLAGREHLIAVAAAIVLGLLHGHGRSLRRRVWSVLRIGGGPAKTQVQGDGERTLTAPLTPYHEPSAVKLPQQRTLSGTSNSMDTPSGTP